MLKNVYIKNLALIEEADIDYTNGLNIMTGETGSGKSIIISALNTALGEKANKSMIRTGAEHGLVELSFHTDDPRVLSVLDKQGIETEDGQIVISRKITMDNSITRINGESVTLAFLRSVTDLLVDVHGQHDHQSLLDPARHLQIIDDFGGESIRNLRKELAEQYDRYRAIRLEYQDYNLDETQLSREIDLLKHEQKEIDDAAIQPEEDIRLETEYKKLSNAETILSSVNKAHNILSDEDDGALKKISDALRYVEDALVYEPELKEYRTTLMDIDSLSKDVAREIAHYVEHNPFDGERFSEIAQRLDQINRLKSKYGRSIDDIYQYAAEIADKLDQYEHYFERKAQTEHRMKECAAILNQLSHQLSDLRKDAGKNLEPLIQKHLKDLNFLHVDFSIDFTKGPKITRNGFDKAEFMISVNPGEPLMPLAKTASGGEMSRIMLAIKSAIADKDDIPTLIFDEIDAGISGQTAGKVGEKLLYLSKHHQIICITHLPQIAAMADAHFRIRKEVEGSSTISGIEKLNETEQVEEVARLVGGITVTDTARANAKELIAYASSLRLA